MARRCKSSAADDLMDLVALFLQRVWVSVRQLLGATCSCYSSLARSAVFSVDRPVGREGHVHTSCSLLEQRGCPLHLAAAN